MMRTLLYKDLRLLLPVLLTGLVLLWLPPLIALIGIWASAAESSVSSSPWYEDFAISLPMLFVFGAMSASLITPAVSATLAARERRDRSAVYLAMLPVPRGASVLSRGILATAGIALPWIVGAVLAGVSLAALKIAWPSHPHVEMGNAREWGEPVMLGALCVLASAGTAWLAGWVLSGEVIPALLGLLVPLAAFILAAFIEYRLHLHLENKGVLNQVLSSQISSALYRRELLVPLLMGLLAEGTIIAGTIVALRRTTP